MNLDYVSFLLNFSALPPNLNIYLICGIIILNKFLEAKKMFRSKEARLVFAILTLVMLAISLLVAVRFVLSAGMLMYDKAAGMELSRASSMSPYGTPETIEEIEANVKSDFAERCWACRIVSGNADTSTTAVILVLEITALMYSGFGMYQITSVVEKSKKK